MREQRHERTTDQPVWGVWLLPGPWLEGRCFLEGSAERPGGCLPAGPEQGVCSRAGAAPEGALPDGGGARAGGSKALS